MAKRWQEVEQSEKYKQLSPQAKTKAKEQYWDQIVSQKPQFKTLDEIKQREAKYQFFGGLKEGDKSPNVTKTWFGEYGRGERNLLGNIVERPGAAIREAIQAPFKGENPIKGYIKGAAAPEDVETFQNLAIDASHKFESPAANFATGMIPSAVGLAADIVTNPVDAATMLLPKVPGVAQVSQALGKTKPVKKLLDFVNTDVRNLAPKQKAGNSYINNVINKAIRPSKRGKKLPKQKQAFDKKSVDAVKDITENKESFKFVDKDGSVKENQLPETIQDFMQAIQQRMKDVYTEYTNLAMKAGDEGAFINTDSFVNKLDDILDDKIFKIEHPRDYREIARLREGLKVRGKMTPLEAQDKIAEWNAELSPSYNQGFKYGSMRAKNILRDLTTDVRQSVDDVITKATGEQYQPLKNAYSSHKALLEDVAGRATVFDRQNPKGIWNFLDIVGTGEIASGILSGNPPLIAKGLALKLGKKGIEMKNNPNRMIADMFKKVDKATKQYNIGTYYNAEGDLISKTAQPVMRGIRKVYGVKEKAAPQMNSASMQRRYISQNPDEVLSTSQTALPGSRPQGLPKPKDVPYNPTGQRVPGQPDDYVVPRKFRLGNETIEKPIEMPNDTWENLVKGARKEIADEIKKAVNSFKESKYVRDIKEMKVESYGISKSKTPNPKTSKYGTTSQKLTSYVNRAEKKIQNAADNFTDENDIISSIVDEVIKMSKKDNIKLTDEAIRMIEKRYE